MPPAWARQTGPRWSAIAAVAPQCRQARLVEPGDVVAVMPGEWHWHGATPDSAMTHVTIQQAEGRTDWDVEERDWAGDCPG